MKQLLVTSNPWRSFGGIEENDHRLHLVVFSELRKVSSVRAVVAGDPHEAALTEAVKLSDGAGQLDPDLNSFGPGVLESAMAASKASTPTTRSSKPSWRNLTCRLQAVSKAGEGFAGLVRSTPRRKPGPVRWGSALPSCLSAEERLLARCP